MSATDNTMRAELLPCPFCGEFDGELSESAVPSGLTGRQKKAVYCNTCFCEGPTADADAVAIAAWNRRADTARQVAEAVAAEREACAALCDVTPAYPFRPSIEAAHAIRARSTPTPPTA